MLKKIICTLAIPATLTFAYAVPAGAKVPPPPVNQNIGIPDSVFNNLDTTGCKFCHTNQDIVNPGTIPDRHHLLVGEAISPHTVAPGTIGATYECLTCHQLVWDPATSSYSFVAFKDTCLTCHQQVAGQASVHHLTDKAQTNDCKACHGLIDNPGDGHYIPVYAPSLVTPRTGLGTGADGEGGCAFCHNTGVEGVLQVYDNELTHHSTGFGLDETKCLLCHDTTVPLNSPTQMRRCENCHGVKSLHNIQVDSDANGIDPGAEAAYYGHIGDQDDCWGCHGFTAAAAPYAGAVMPDISGVSDSTVTAGFDTQITISGAAFTNIVQGPDGPIELTSTIRLKAGDGSETNLAPDSITEGTIVVTIPAAMAPGNYALCAVKGGSTSNTVNLAIMPEVQITSASCLNGVVSITGSGFSQYVNATGSGTSVSLPGAVADCSVLSWNDTNIVAQCGECDPSINVDSVFGDATGAVTVKKIIIRRPSSR